MLTPPQKKKKKKNSKFHYSYNNFDRDPPKEYVLFFFLEWIWCEFSGDVVWYLFSHIWSYVNKKTRNCKKTII